MESKFTIRQFLNRYSYLLIIAAWLVTISFIIDHYWSANSSLKRAEDLVKSHLKDQEADLIKSVNDDKLIKGLEQNAGLVSSKESEQLLKKDYFLFFYKKNEFARPYFWNTQQAQPVPEMFSDASEKGIVSLANGFFIWEKFHRRNSLVIAIIPVKWRYDSSYNGKSYLVNEFSVKGILADDYEVEPVSYRDGGVKKIKVTDMFRLIEKKSENRLIDKNNVLSVLLNLAALILLLVFLHFFVSYISSKYGFLQGLLLLILIAIALSYISRTSWLPVNLRQFDLFDPVKYGYKNIFTSLGDMIIRMLLLLWIVIFVRACFRDKPDNFMVKDKIRKWSVLVVTAIMSLSSSYFMALIVQSLVEDSKISFDVMDFFTLDRFTIFGFLAISVSLITYFFLNCLLVEVLRKSFRNFLLPLYAVIATVSLLLLSLFIGKIENLEFQFSLLLWIFLFLFLLKSDLSRFITEDKIVTSKLVFWLVFFSLSASVVIKSKSADRDREQRISVAKHVAEETDPSKVYQLNPYFNGMNGYIRSNTYAKLDNNNPDLKFLLDSLNDVNKLESCNENFNIYLFGFSAESDNRILINKNLYSRTNEPKSFDELNNIFLRLSFQTIESNLRYFESEPNSIAYISRKRIIESAYDSTEEVNFRDSTQKILAYYFILALPKKSGQGEETIRSLLNNVENVQLEKSNSYSWAVYKKNLSNKYCLNENHNNYPFKTSLDEDESNVLDNKVIQNGVYSELWYNAGGSKIICVVKENSLLTAVSFFSYFFCSFLIIVLILWLVSVIVRARLNYKVIIHYWRISIRNQIHISIISLSVLSFLFVAITTIWFFIVKSDESETEKVRKLTMTEKMEIEKIISPIEGENTGLNNEVIKERLQNKITEFSESEKLELLIYNPDGTLNSKSYIIKGLLEKGIQNNFMNPLAFDHLARKKEVSFSHQESIGNRKYTSNYIVLSDSKLSSEHTVLGYLNIRYLESQIKLKKDISNFLVAIINLNAFIFLIAGIISLLITQRISRSFSFISEKMKKINLTKQNEVIEWNRDDEIGQLISEYNRMVQKLEESADALAKTEREGAWREMAKQVAHEIKNPLTPMKLNLQFLQRAIANNDPNVKEMASRMSVTLIEQIDHLSNIAGQFSQFANISESRNEVININDLIKSVIQLMATTNDVIIEHELSPGKLFINADRTQMNRLFTNLILNAIQAVPESRQAIISIKEILGEETVTIIIQDNGSGIDEATQEKIFTPNFTTKNSGTGLGLAMCKKIVEQAGGEIWFETEIGKGTNFYIRLPKSLDQ